MSSWEHPRQRIFNSAQHPYHHSLSEFTFSTTKVPGITNAEDMFNYILNVLYPHSLGTFATPAALPVAPAANSYAFVTDDGDGKSAGYIFQVIDGAGQWFKRYDVDWSLESILAEGESRTQALYVSKYGFDDHNAAGVTLTGALAGQHIYGGASASTHLTLHANSGDLSGRTGFVQLDDSTRPTVDNALTLGTAIARFSVGYFVDLQIATLTSTGTLIVGGNVTATGAVTGSNLSGTNTGDVTLGTFDSTPNSKGLSISGQVLKLAAADGTNPGAVTTGAQTFGGVKTFSSSVVIGTGLTISLGGATITGTVGITGNISATNLSGTNTGDVTLAAAIGSSPNNAGASLASQVLTLQPADGTHGGVLTASTQTIGGDKTLTGATVLSSAGTALSVTNNATISGSLTLTTNLINGAATFVMSELVKLRNVMFRDAARSLAVQNGDALFYDSTSGTWLASAPDTEITHSGLTGLTTGDAGHTQFALLAGRSGGQSLTGGTAASENLTLESTSNGTKGKILVSSKVSPTTTAAFSSTWSGTDLGDTTHYFNDVYTKGEMKGMRLENYTSSTLPSPSAQNTGRLVYSTDDKQIYADDGGSSMVKIGVRRFMSDTSWSAATTKTVTVSASITDARLAIWALLDVSDSYNRMYVSIQAISATQVTITTELALTGTYRLIGLE